MVFEHKVEMKVRGRCESDAKDVGAVLVGAGDVPGKSAVLVSERALYSYGYYDCRGVVMVQGNKAGLCHMQPESDVKAFLGSMLKEFDKKKPVSVFLLEATRKYPGDLESVCKGLGLNVLKKFVRVDDVCSNCVLVFPQKKMLFFYDRKGRKSFTWD